MSGHDKASLTEFGGATGKVVYSAEIGGSTDSAVYDAERKRISSAKGVSADLGVFSQDGPGSYKPIAMFGTRAGMRTATDHASDTLDAVMAENAAWACRKTLTTVSPLCANTLLPSTSPVLTYGTKWSSERDEP